MFYLKKIATGLMAIAFVWALNGITGFGGCGTAGSTRAASGETGGTGGSGVTALEIADQMALVTASESGTSSSLSALVKLAVPASGDYLTDQPEIWVYDESMQALDLINEILCSVEQTAYASKLNAGDYIALIDVTACEGRRQDRSSEGSNQSSSESREFETWVVNSSRVDDSSPQVVTFWLQVAPGAQDPFDEIRAKLTITAAKSDSNPYGEFSMNFIGYTEGTQTMTGSLSSSTTSSGLVEFQMILEAGSALQEQTHAIITADGLSGQAYVSRSGNFGMDSYNETANVAFDEGHYLADFEERTKCLDRQNFRKNVWEYNLYNAAGDRLERNSGMSIKVGDNDHNYGWADYYGVWIPEHLGTIAAGDQVTNEDGTATYTVFQGGGHLIRRTRQDLTLGDFLGDTFYMWDQNASQTFLVRWDGTNIVKFGIDQCNQNGCSQTTIPEENVTLEPNGFIGLWKQGLGNLDIVVPESGQLSNSLAVPLYKEEFVTPSDSIFASGDLTIKCYSMCPKAPLTAADFNSGDLFETDITDSETDPYIYTISATDMTLKRNGESVTIALGTPIDPSSPNFWGFRSGAMVTTSTTVDNPWDVWSKETQYTYEAGPNNWNFYTALLDSNGEAVSFEAPLKCLYQDAVNGTYYLDYHGEGRLFGIPYEKVESDDSEFEMWVAQFIIDDGTELDCDGTPYYTKAMAIEQSMAEVDASACSALSISGVGAPENQFTDPEVGTMPTVTDAPAVIGGIVQ